MDESSELFLFPIKTRFPNPEAGGIRGRNLNTNQLHNIEQLLNTNEQLFWKEITPLITYQ